MEAAALERPVIAAADVLTADCGWPGLVCSSRQGVQGTLSPCRRSKLARCAGELHASVSKRECLVSKLGTAAIVVGGVAVGLTWWQWPSDDPQSVPARVEDVRQYDIAPPPLPDPGEVRFERAASAPVAQPRRPAFKTSEFGRKLLEAKDIKAFVIEALKHPEKGGAYYAALAMNQCSPNGFADMKAKADRTIQRIVATESTISQERMDAINAGLVLCVGFSEGERNVLYGEASRYGVEGIDPLYSLSAKLRSGRFPRDKLFQDILESGSWALISRLSVPTRLIQAGSEDGATGRTYRFNGNTYAGAEAHALLVGSRLGTCVDGDYCDLDEEMRTQCRALGTCYGSRAEYVRQRWFKGDQAAYDKAAAIGDEIRSALARGDRSIFR